MIYTLWKSGELDKFIKLDVLRPRIVRYCEIYDEYVKWRAIGYNYNQAAEMTAEKMCVADITVKKAIAYVI